MEASISSFFFFSQQLLFFFSFAEAAGAADLIEVNGEFGGTVIINCPIIPKKTILYFYFQKPGPGPKPIFVNGFYNGHSNKTPLKANSRLDPEKNTTVHMSNLTVDDGGYYDCHLEYTDDSKKDTKVYINITGKYDALFKPLGFLSSVKIDKIVNWRGVRSSIMATSRGLIALKKKSKNTF